MQDKLSGDVLEKWSLRVSDQNIPSRMSFLLLFPAAVSTIA